MSNNSNDALEEISKLTTKLQKLRVQEQDIINKITQLASRTTNKTSYIRYDCNGCLIRIGDKVEICTKGRNKSNSGIVTGHDSRFVIVSGNYINPNTKKRETIKRESQNLSVLKL